MKPQPSFNGTNGHASRSENLTDEQIAAAAYHLYLERGHQDGHDLDDWLRAEELLTRQMRSLVLVSPSNSHSTSSIHPLDSRENPLARDERGVASREEIWRETTEIRPAARQSLRRPERANQAR